MSTSIIEHKREQDERIGKGSELFLADPGKLLPEPELRPQPALIR
ncbi:MAG TPA: hypothetical protein VFV38_19025 [Ktedonobacteraceae bacterium]|nr:hypothetical protein [Ktedonobacteraceae bacterium]